MSDTLIPDTRFHFATKDGEKRIALDPIKTIREIHAIIERCSGKTAFEHVDEFREWVQAETGVDLTADEADWVMDAVRVEYDREKKARLGPLLSPAATDSTPSDSPDDN